MKSLDSIVKATNRGHIVDNDAEVVNYDKGLSKFRLSKELLRNIIKVNTASGIIVNHGNIAKASTSGLIAIIHRIMETKYS